ncbi:hypothetical protein GCM10009092_22170 [Bowmanella denitrificans]|uniref:Glycosyl transferase family 28 C-terminal domain-containing protein n=1 Tax=Bowmanella denitrificans TaxID=366582 RepID=A0ABN0X829_9ALTE
MAPHLLYCWELGQGYGHVLNFRHLALRLLEQGWRVSCVTKNLDVSRKMLPEIQDIRATPATDRQVKHNPTRNLAEILVNNGFHDQRNTLNRCQAWLDIFTELQPDIVLIDHAPTALLVSHAADIPRVLMGTGFFIPPDTKPLPFLLSHLLGEQQSGAEDQVLSQCNAFLQSARKPPLAYFSQLFSQADDCFLCTLPEFDHYSQRQDAEYWGPCFDFEQGALPQWSQEDKPRIFVYLHQDFVAMPTILQQLHELDAAVSLHISGIEQDVTAQYPKFTWHRDAVNLAAVAAECDLVICHAGHGTLSGMLLNAVPLLLLPKQLEQWILAELLCRRYLAYFIPPEGDYQNLADKINRILNDDKLRQNLTAFANTYAGFSHQEQKQGMLEALQTLLENKKPGLTPGFV